MGQAVKRKRSCAPLPGELISTRIRKLLRYGDENGMYGGDDFRVGCAIIAAGARAEMPPAQLWMKLTNPKNLGGSACHGNASNRIDERRMLNLYETSAAVYSSDWENATDVRAALAVAAEAVLESTLDNDRSGSARKVLLAHLTAAIRTGSSKYRASVRRIADDAQVSVKTVQSAQVKLQTAGLLYRERSGTVRQPTLWHLPVRAIADKVTTVRHRQIKVGTTVVSLSAYSEHPAWRYGSGLNHATWCLLSPDDWATPQELAQATGRDARTIRRHLMNLVAADLAERCDNGTYRALVSLDAMNAHAERTGMVERKQRQRQRHQQDRLQHREALRDQNQQTLMEQWSGEWVNPETGEVIEAASVTTTALPSSPFGHLPAGSLPRKASRSGTPLTTARAVQLDGAA